MTPTTNLSLKKIDGSENWREIFDDHNDSMDLIDAAVKSNSDEISTTEKSLIYVVDGNKCANAVPVGSYVQLINSTISGRSDGCYTVKTAIPANTAIDNTYFNETAPIAGGAINSLNSNIESLPIIKSVTGTLSNSSGYSYTSYPSGFTKSNSVIIGFEIKVDGKYRSGLGVNSTSFARCFAELDTNPTVYNADSNNYSSDFRITLLRYPS